MYVYIYICMYIFYWFLASCCKCTQNWCMFSTKPHKGEWVIKTGLAFSKVLLLDRAVWSACPVCCLQACVFVGSFSWALVRQLPGMHILNVAAVWCYWLGSTSQEQSTLTRTWLSRGWEERPPQGEGCTKKWNGAGMPSGAERTGEKTAEGS